MDRLHRNESFCAHTILDDLQSVFTIPDTLADSRFATNPLVTGSTHIRFYAGTSLRVAGERVGVLSFMDTTARAELTADEKRIFMDIASMVSDVLTERYQRNKTYASKLVPIENSILQLIRSPVARMVKSEKTLQVLFDDVRAHGVLNPSTIEELDTHLRQLQYHAACLETLINVSLPVVARMFCVDRTSIINKPQHLKRPGESWLKQLCQSLTTHATLDSGCIQHDFEYIKLMSYKSVYAHCDVLEFALNAFVSCLDPGDKVASITIGCEAATTALSDCVQTSSMPLCFPRTTSSPSLSMSRSKSYDAFDRAEDWTSGQLTVTIAYNRDEAAYERRHHSPSNADKVQLLRSIVDLVSGKVRDNGQGDEGEGKQEGQSSKVTDKFHHNPTIIVVAIPCAIRSNKCTISRNVSFDSYSSSVEESEEVSNSR